MGFSQFWNATCQLSKSKYFVCNVSSMFFDYIHFAPYYYSHPLIMPQRNKMTLTYSPIILKLYISTKLQACFRLFECLFMSVISSPAFSFLSLFRKPHTHHLFWHHLSHPSQLCIFHAPPHTKSTHSHTKQTSIFCTTLNYATSNIQLYLHLWSCSSWFYPH